MKSISSITVKTSLVLCLLYLSWGGSFLAINLVLEDFPPVFQNGLRLCLAGMIGLLFLPVKKQGARISGMELLHCWNTAFLLMFLTGILQAFAQQTVSSGIAALIFGTVPLLMILAGWLFAGEPRPVLKQLAGILGATAGIAVLSLGDGGCESQQDPTGMLLLFGASLSFVAGSLYMKHISSHSSLTIYGNSSVIMFFAGLQSIASSLIIGERFIPGNVNMKAWIALLFLVVFTSVLGNISYCWLLGHSGTIAAVSFAWVDPVVAVTLGHFVLDEHVTVTAVAACFLIVLSVLLSLPCRHTASSPSGI